MDTTPIHDPLIVLMESSSQTILSLRLSTAYGSGLPVGNVCSYLGRNYVRHQTVFIRDTTGGGKKHVSPEMQMSKRDEAAGIP